MFLSPVVDSKDPSIWYVPSHNDQIRPVQADEKIAWMVVKERTPIIEIFFNQTEQAGWVKRTLSTERNITKIEKGPLRQLMQAGEPLNARAKSRLKGMPEALDPEIQRIVQRTLEEVQREWKKGFPPAKKQLIIKRPWKEFPDWNPNFSEKELQHVDIDWVQVERSRSPQEAKRPDEWVEVETLPCPKGNSMVSFWESSRFSIQQLLA